MTGFDCEDREDRDDRQRELKTELDRRWTEYVEESEHDGEPVSLADFGVYLKHVASGETYVPLDTLSPVSDDDRPF